MRVIASAIIDRLAVPAWTTKPLQEEGHSDGY